MAKSKGMTEADLQAVIQSRLTDSLNGDEASAFQEARLTALQYYRGDAVGKLAGPDKGRSSVVSRDSAESIDSLLPGLMKIFVGSDKTGVFEPTREEEQEGADQATDYVNWIWLMKNNGALVFHDFAKDALQYRLGILKVWWQNEERRRRESYKGLTPDELAQLDLDDDDEIKSLTEYETVLPGEPGPDGLPTQVPVKLTDIVFYRMHEEGCVKIVNVPPEDFFTDKRAISDETLPFAGHRFQTTVSDLIEDGFDRDQVENLPGGTDDWAAEKTERNLPEDGSDTTADADSPIDKSMRKVWVAEVYLRVDYDGDGIAEWRKVTVAGPKAQLQILKKRKKSKDEDAETYEPDIAEVDDHPFCTMTPYPTPHKLVGESVVDKVQDIQEVNTALIRGVLDTIYQSSKPRPVIGNKVNVDDVLNHEIGYPIRVDEGGTVGDQVAWITPPAGSAAASLQAMEYFDQRKEIRTGVSRLTQGLDANAINKTATGVNAITNFSQERQALIARIFAEGGMKRVFKKILELVCKYQDKPKVIKLRGKWVSMNPTEWSDEMDFISSVGIGTGNKDQMLMHLQNIYQIQTQIVQFQQGLNGPLVTAPNVYNTLAKIVENAGLKSAELYFTDPGSEEMQQQQQPQEPQPDPAMMKAQADIQAKQMTTEADIALKQQSAEADIALKAKAQEADFVLKARGQAASQGLAAQSADRKAGMEERQSQPQIIVGADGKAAQIGDTTAQMAEMLMAFIQRQSERDAAQDQQMAAMMQMLAAPKMIDRGPDGRAVGVRTVMQ